MGAKIDNMYPAGRRGPSFDDSVVSAVRDFNPDVLISLYDTWALQFPKDKQFKKLDVPWIAWSPIDSLPLGRFDKENFNLADGVVALTRWAEEGLIDGGIENSHYIPHGIQTNVFQPLEEIPGKDPDTFLVGMVGLNNFHPSRKSIPEMLQAFAHLKSNYNNVKFYMHTHWDQRGTGVDIGWLVKELGIEEDVIFPSPDNLEFGFEDQYMVTMYNEFDVLLSPSKGEGFGIPIMEAQACGTPVIATNYSSMPELVGDAGGWLVDGVKYLTPRNNWWMTPSIDGIFRALDSAYRAWRDGGLYERRVAARKKALLYDFGGVIVPMWEEYLEGFV